MRHSSSRRTKKILSWIPQECRSPDMLITLAITIIILPVMLAWPLFDLGR